MGCTDSEQPSVTFGDRAGPIGKWQAVSDAPDAAQPDLEPEPEPEPEDRDAGSARDEDEDAERKPITSLTFEVTTAIIGGKYKPKNVGAIWIADGSGKLVKTLEVWAATRMRYLTEYNKARAGSSVDVSARATLPSHRVHRVTWELKDRSGAAVPARKYQLFLELTDTDATGKTTRIDIDLSGEPATQHPPDAAGFTGMTLELK